MDFLKGELFFLSLMKILHYFDSFDRLFYTNAGKYRKINNQTTGGKYS